MMVSTSWSGCELKLNNLVKHVNECMVQNKPSISISSLPLLSPDRVSCIQEVLGLSCIYIVIESHVQSDSLIHLPHNRDNQTQTMCSPLVILGHGQVPKRQEEGRKGWDLDLTLPRGKDCSQITGPHANSEDAVCPAWDTVISDHRPPKSTAKKKCPKRSSRMSQWVDGAQQQELGGNDAQVCRKADGSLGTLLAPDTR